MIRVASVACLLAAAIFWVAPTSAFNSASYSRGATANVTADAAAYNAPFFPPCALDNATGGSCTFYIFNNGTTTQTYTVTSQTNPSNIVSALDVDSTGTGTGVAKTVGQTSTIVATITPCLACGSQTVDWMFQGTNANVMDWREEHVAMTVVFT